MPYSILIVEDDPFLLRLLTVKLSEVPGLSVDFASDGEVALEKIRKNSPALIILDIMIPKKSGLEVLKELRQDPSIASTPVIIISNLGGSEEIKQAKELGVVDYFVKTTITISELLDRIRQHLSSPVAKDYPSTSSG